MKKRIVVLAIREASAAQPRVRSHPAQMGCVSTSIDLGSALRRNMLVWIAAHARRRCARLTFAMTLMGASFSPHQIPLSWGQPLLCLLRGTPASRPQNQVGHPDSTEPKLTFY